MSRYKPPTIAEQGGLQVYLEKSGIDYPLFKSLRATIGDRHKAIADALTKQAGLPEPITAWRVRNWCSVDDEEMRQHDSSTTD